MLNYIEYLVGVAITTVVGSLTYLVRTVLTNQTEIDLLKANLISRDKSREEDRQLLLDIKADLKSEMKETRQEIEVLRNELWNRK